MSKRVILTDDELVVVRGMILDSLEWLKEAKNPVMILGRADLKRLLAKLGGIDGRE